MTEEKIKKMKFSSVTTALLCLLIGIVMIIYPGRSLDVICQVFGVVLIGGGVMCIIFFLQDVHALTNVMMLTGGIIFAAIGIWIFTKPRGIETIIPFIAGIVIVIDGIFNCIQTADLGRAKFSRWWVAMILSILTIGLGILLIINPFGAVSAIARIIGAFMVYDAVSDLWIIIDVSRAYRNIKQEVTAVDVEATVEETENKNKE